MMASFASDGPLKNCDMATLRRLRYEGSLAVADVRTTLSPAVAGTCGVLLASP
jgi:hypothetical protein